MRNPNTRHNQIKDGNARLQLSISKEAEQLLRQHSKKKGDASKIVEDLILDKWGDSTCVVSPCRN